MFYSLRAEIQGTGSGSERAVNCHFNKSSAIAERPRDAPCR